MIRERYQLKQTVVTILARDEKYVEIAKKAIIHHRHLLEEYIEIDPMFALTLEPYEVDDAPEVVKRMAQASSYMGVGPMAAVAGTIAELALEAMIEEGAEFGIVDNGGDIAMFTDDEVRVGLYAGRTEGLCMTMPPTKGILGVCTSSGTIGHSISFGDADAATVISKDVSLADAGATLLGNSVHGDLSRDVFNDLKTRDKQKLVEGAIVVKGEKIALFGNVPKIVRSRIPPDLITRG